MCNVIGSEKRLKSFICGVDPRLQPIHVTHIGRCTKFYGTGKLTKTITTTKPISEQRLWRDQAATWHAHIFPESLFHHRLLRVSCTVCYCSNKLALVIESSNCLTDREVGESTSANPLSADTARSAFAHVASN